VIRNPEITKNTSTPTYPPAPASKTYMAANDCNNGYSAKPIYVRPIWSLDSAWKPKLLDVPMTRAAARPAVPRGS
jgi:hypothetical protein